MINIGEQYELGYANLSTEEVLMKVIPQSVSETVPQSFETVGHVAHYNLREEFMPYKRLIGKVCLDKNPAIETVLTKVDNLKNEFRTFNFEVIGGSGDTNVVVKEADITLKFDFAKTYWNSRLSQERQRLLQIIYGEGSG